MLQAVFFDFDGVIANSEPLHLRAYQSVLRPAKINLGRDEYYQRYLGYDDEGLFRTLAKDRGLTIDAATIDNWIVAKTAMIQTLLADPAILFPGAAECVRMCADRVPVAVASGALEPEINVVLEHAGLRKYFRAIASASDGVPGKPAPDLYLLAIRKLRQFAAIDPAACVAIEDSHWGLRAARAAGLRTIAVTHTYPAAELEEADVVVNDLGDVTVEELDRVLRDNSRTR